MLEFNIKYLITFIFFCCSLSVNSIAWSFDKYSYFGAGVGFANSDEGEIKLTRTSKANVNNNPVLGKLFYGYRFSRFSSVELEFVKFKRFRGEVVTSSDEGKPEYNISFSTFSLFSRWILPMDLVEAEIPFINEMSVFLRFGLGLFKVKDGPKKYHNNHISMVIPAGLGVEYMFNDILFLRTDFSVQLFEMVVRREELNEREGGGFLFGVGSIMFSAGYAY